jgi:site-specific DNA-methyltransferase (adenine-specific)
MHHNTIINGDCRDVLRTIPSASVDFVLTDPPYVGRYTSRDGRSIRNDNWNWMKPAFRELYRVLKRDTFCVCFYGWAHADKFVNAFRDAGFYIGGQPPSAIRPPPPSASRFSAQKPSSEPSNAVSGPASPPR